MLCPLPDPCAVADWEFALIFLAALQSASVRDGRSSRLTSDGGRSIGPVAACGAPGANGFASVMGGVD